MSIVVHFLVSPGVSTRQERIYLQCRRPRCDPWVEKGMATHSNILTCRILYTEEPVGYSPWGHKVRHH